MRNNRILKVIVIVGILVVIVYFSYSFILEWHSGGIEKAKNQERQVWKEQAATLKKEIADLEEEIIELKGQKIPHEKLEEAFGKEASPFSPEGGSMTFEDIESQIVAFFAYLDEKEYVKENKLTGSTYSQYEFSVTQLSANHPIIAGETEDLYNLLYNVAHFYRVLGKERVFLVRDILNNESDIIESVMKTFFMWYTYENGPGKEIKGIPSLRVLYDYAGFFLTTLGGKSYLLRRDSNIRILTTYYCVMILDKANDSKLNSNGIDIRPYIKTTLDDIASHMGLINQREYIRELENLKVKYKIS